MFTDYTFIEGNTSTIMKNSLNMQFVYFIIRCRMLFRGFQMKKFTIDFSHSTIGFSVRHMMISRIHGTFESYSGEIVAANIEQMQDANISITIIVASVSTKNHDRDVHLVSPDFLMQTSIQK